MNLSKLIVFLITLSFSFNAEADLQSLRMRRQQNKNHSTTPSFRLFRGSMINCTSLRDQDDFLITYNPENHHYNFFERMYSWDKDCTLEQDLFIALLEKDTCFFEGLERVSLQAQEIAHDFEEELKNDYSDYQHYFQTRIRLLIEDERPNLIQAALKNLRSAVGSGNQARACPWKFSVYVSVTFRTYGQARRFERVIDSSEL
jgi:hypothetical protein